MFRILLNLQNLSYQNDDREILHGVDASIFRTDHIGLVGHNGVGKTTLLRLILGELKPNSGTIEKHGYIAYVPQLNLDVYRKEIELYEYLEAFISEWWTVLILAEQHFNLVLNERQLLSTLSGGELVKLHICLALAYKPDLLLLDEPTNHLDFASIHALEVLLKNLAIPFILVSHNVNLLNNCVNTIWEIKDKKLEAFGGNYNFYREQIRLKELAQLQEYEATKKELKKSQLSLQKEQIKYQKAQSKISNMLKSGDRSIPKIILTQMKKRGQTTHGVAKIKLDNSVEDLAQKVQTLKPNLRRNIYVNLQTSMNSGSNLFSIEGGSLSVGNKLLLDNIEFNVYQGERILIAGSNGSGKTTFVQALGNNNIQGEIKKKPDLKILFVDQKYDLVDGSKTLLQNLLELNLAYTKARKYLANLGFTSEFEINKKASVLSGGELARLAFALISAQNPGILVLDEPTNNLDVDTSKGLTELIKSYKGTLLVISHDLKFLQEIEINKAYMIKTKRLISMHNLPANEQAFIAELVQS